jgi:hypothetical protein
MIEGIKYMPGDEAMGINSTILANGLTPLATLQPGKFAYTAVARVDIL